MIGSQFNLHDLSQISEVSAPKVYDNSPKIYACFGASKGTEELFELSGDKFVKMFGDLSYKDFGQVAVQTRRAVEEGAIIVGKRIVADDAKLAHAIISANVYGTTVQRTDSEGNNLYYGVDGVATTESTNEEGDPLDPINDTTAHVYYTISSVASGVKTVDEILEAMKSAVATDVDTEIDGQTVKVSTFPIFCVADNGRGVSVKRFRILPENQLSKNLKFMYYTLDVIENGGSTSESITFTMVPDIISGDRCLDMNTIAGANLSLEKARMDEDVMTAFITKLSEISGIEEEELMENDIIFGTNRKGVAYPTIKVDLDDVDISISSGIELVGGDNGYFGNSPETNINTIPGGGMTVRDKYYDLMKDFYSGKITEDIYDVDSYQIDAVFDADFPISVKEAIVELAKFRKDFILFRDYGKECYSLDQIKEYRMQLSHTFFAADFCQAYDVVDKYSKKQINVSIMYSLTPMIINHIRNSRNLPFAGSRYNAVIDEIIPGTLNYKARVTPKINEKTELEDIKVNFGSYFKDEFTIESVFTSQDELSQLSYYPNVLALQQVIKALRVHFPAVRFAFITNTDDLNSYTTEINDFLDAYRSNFEELEFKYVGNQTYLDNKIYKAMISFRFGNFIQAELIDAYALPSIGTV